MLKTRVISSVIMGILLVSIVIFESSLPVLLNIAIGAISALCVYELIKASGLEKRLALIIPSITISFFIPFSNLVSHEVEFSIYCLYSFTMFIMLIACHKRVSFKELAIIYSMSIMIPTALGTIILARVIDVDHGIFYTVIAVIAAWIPDIGAYFAGTYLGKHKLCPDISPKKTVEGFIGGIIANIIGMLIAGLFFSYVYYAGQPTAANLYIMMLIGVAGAIAGTIGDLSFSLIKRSCGIKDFGHIIPGHGGILDRFDSVVFTAPVVYIIVTFLPPILN
ncbi:MAG: phosphatidate cytidylyltransferase [Clostridia bacterium]